MKRRMQKIFITLLALFIAGFAMANAYVFDVTNRSPFGTLNLSKLVIKDLTHTGIILDLDSYTIKIDPGNEDQAGGQIRVYEICDENGGNCRKITELYTGSTGVPGPQGPQGPKGDTGAVGAAGVAGAAGASINTGYWNGDDLIFKRDDGFEIRLVNAKNILKGPQGEAGAPGSGGSGGTNANDGALIFYKDSTIYKRFSANTGASVSVQLTPAGTNGRLCIKSGSDIECYTTGFVTTGQLKNGTLTIKRNGVTGGVFSANTGSNVTVDIDVPVISGSADYICVKNGNNLECSKAQLGIMGGNDGICRYSNGVIDCNYTDQVGNPGNGSTGIYVGGTTGYICTLAGENRINCQENTGNFVYVSATQTIGGTKTFSTSPVVPSKTSAAGNNGTTIATEAQVYAVDQKITTLSGNVNNIPYVSKNNVNQTISGTKTFVTSPVVPNKTSAAGNNGTTIATEAQVYKVQQGVDNLSGNLTKFLTESQIVDLINAAIALIDKPENATITIYQGGTPKGSFTLNQSSDTGIYLELGGETTIQGEDGQRCTYKCTEYREPEHKECIKGEIQCTAPAPSCEGQCTGGGDNYTLPTASTAILGGVKLGSDDVQTTNSQSPSHNAGRTYPVQFDKNGRLVVNVPRTSSNGGSGISMGSYYVDNTGYYCISTDSNSIRCNVPMPSGISVGGDSLWTTGKDTLGNFMLTPTKSINSIYLISSTQNANNPAMIRHDGYLRIQKSGINLASSPVQFDAKGAKFGNVNMARNINSFYARTGTARATNLDGAGVSIAGQLILGNSASNNYIYLYSSGNAGSGDAHYEIKANKELAIGVNSGAYIYFQSYAGNTSSQNYRNQRIGINTNTPLATLDVKGSIRVSDEGNCFPPCTSLSAGAIIYRQQTDSFYGCKQDGQRHLINMGAGVGGNGSMTQCEAIMTPQIQEK